MTSEDPAHFECPGCRARRNTFRIFMDRFYCLICGEKLEIVKAVKEPVVFHVPALVIHGGPDMAGKSACGLDVSGRTFSMNLADITCSDCHKAIDDSFLATVRPANG